MDSKPVKDESNTNGGQQMFTIKRQSSLLRLFAKPSAHDAPVSKPDIVDEEIDSTLHLRKLNEEDFHKGDQKDGFSTDITQGFLDLLSQLTDVGATNKETFNERLNEIEKNPDQIVIVVENITKKKVVAAGTLLIERKFIHGGGAVGHIEDIVVDSSERGKSLGKVIVEKLRKIGETVGCYKVILDCDEKLVGFYEKCGFKKKAVQMAWYREHKP